MQRRVERVVAHSLSHSPDTTTTLQQQRVLSRTTFAGDMVLQTKDYVYVFFVDDFRARLKALEL